MKACSYRECLVLRMSALLMAAGMLAVPSRAAVVATGGDVTNGIGIYKVHVFTNVGAHELVVTTGGQVEYLIVAGGGGGQSGGGGAGGYLKFVTHEADNNSDLISATPTNYTILVGGGGTGKAFGGGQGDDGGNSSAFGLTAIGGGGGGDNGATTNTASGRSGGSGGGASTQNVTGSPGGAGTPGQGRNGGNAGGSTGANSRHGGGGGAWTAGTSATASAAGNGGKGVQSTIIGTTNFYAGGGGGGAGRAGDGGGGLAGQGGGGRGGIGNSNNTGSDAEDGTPNTGGGGGGIGSGILGGGKGGDGGSGIVIVRYVDHTLPLTVTASVRSTEVGIADATLRGRVGGIGGAEPPEVYLCWGSVNPETTNTGDWARVESIGNEWLAGDYFSHEISGLIPNQTYYYRAYVTNSSGGAWSETIPFGRRVLYVATNATPAEPWGTWATAFTNLQEAFTAATNGDAILLAGGQTFEGGALGSAYPSNTVFLLQGVSNVTIRGGYQADPLLPFADHPGTNDPIQWTTFLRRASGNVRVLTLNAVSNVLFEGVTITNGYMSSSAASTALGGGVRVDGSRNVTFSKSDISGNTAHATGGITRRPDGGGIYITGSDVSILDSRLVGNRANGGDNTHTMGGAAFVTGGSLTILRSLIGGNLSSGNGTGTGRAGGFYITSTGSLDVRESVVNFNNATHNQSGDVGEAGAVFNAGTLWMQNCLVVSNRNIRTTAHSDGLFLNGGTATVVNCTIADNYRIGVRYNAGVVSVSNSIIWGHTSSDLLNFPADGNGKLPDVWYSCIQTSPNAGFQGCTGVDPLFVDRTYYHLQSTEGHYSGGYFSGGGWTTAAADSPVIDRGGPDAANWSREPLPNGERINMGAYGGTEVAAKTATLVVNSPQVDNPGAQVWGHRTVTLRGIVTDTGGQLPEAWFLYALDGDPLSNRTDVGPQGGSFSAAISGLTPGLLYQYAVVASNQGGVVQSDSAWFSTHPVGSSLYVATNGHHTAGTNWSTAYNDLQTAFDIAEAGDAIYLAGHTFARAADFGNLFAFRMQNLTNITIRGGYDAAGDDPLPGARNASTRLTRASGDIRVLTLNTVSNVSIERVTITNGYLQTSAANTALGGGVHVTASRAVTFAECDISGNTARGTVNSHPQGGGIHVDDNSEVTLVDSRLVGNSATGGGNTSTRGGAAYVASGSLTVLRSRVSHNQSRGNGSGHGYAGGLFVAASGFLDIRESVMSSNSVSIGSSSAGGAVFNAGTLWMQNCLVVSNQNIRTPSHSDGLFLNGGTVTLMNCTIADNHAIGIRYDSGAVAVTNSILWGHTTSNVWNYPQSGGIFQNMGYTLMGGHPAMDGVNGCLVADPLFDDRVYYHIQSRKGVYRDGYFSGGTWENADENSPALDAGDPASGVRDEPQPHGRRINMGAYGGTSVASISTAPMATIILLR